MAVVQDPAEHRISCQFIHCTRIAKNTHQSATMFVSLRKANPEWALDPAFISHNANFSRWLREVPEDMQIAYPQDGTAPRILSHEIANMHIYHSLATILHFRPQLHATTNIHEDIGLQYLITCCSAAKNICKLQEAILKTHGIPGLSCAIRGMSFHIYAALTCITLYLVRAYVHSR